jgi:hypothetical protein
MAGRRLPGEMPMGKKASATSWAAGRWSIESMEEWDKDFIDEEVPGYFEFEANHLGAFQFGYVTGNIDYRVTERDGKPAVEYSFEAMDELDPRSGRGWFVLEGEKLIGRFFFHQGDESGIVLSREVEKKPRKPRKKK